MITSAFLLCAAAGLDAALSNSAPDSPPASQLVISDARLTSHSCKNIGDVAFYLLWSEGRLRPRDEGRINCKLNLNILLLLF